MKDLINAAGEFLKAALRVFLLGEDEPPKSKQEKQKGSP